MQSSRVLIAAGMAVVLWFGQAGLGAQPITGSASSDVPQEPEELVRSVVAKVFTISNVPQEQDNPRTDDFDERQENVVATCFFARKDLIVTARHILTRFVYPRHLQVLRIRNTKMIYSTALPPVTNDLALEQDFEICDHKNYDLALLRLKPTAKYYRQLTAAWRSFVLPIETGDTSPVEIGVPVALVGYAGSTTKRSPVFVFGHLGGYEHGKAGPVIRYIFDRGLQGGFSGGPVISRRTGKVVAVTRHGRGDGGASFTWGASNIALIGFIQAHYPDFRPAQEP